MLDCAVLFMIKAVIFDLDGTIANTLLDLTDAVNYALCKYSLPERSVEEVRTFVGNGMRNLIERSSGMAPEGETFEEILATFKAHYDIHFCDKTYAYDGICDLIAELKNRGLKTAVVTNKDQGVSRIIVNKLCGNVFDIVCGKLDGVPAKPDPTSTKMVIKELGVRPEECVFMGDSDVDILTGIRSGANAVGETWGFRDRALLKSVGAKTIIDHPMELLEVIDKLNNEL
ncbi:MAG: HAD family hydrolase [Ruminococcaceae bacterium]|nr:HAD family hydrolase [Oscillospiraceae bacterium]